MPLIECICCGNSNADKPSSQINLILFELDDNLLGPERKTSPETICFRFLRFHFFIDANLALSDHRFRLATTSNHALELQNLVQLTGSFVTITSLLNL